MRYGYYEAYSSYLYRLKHTKIHAFNHYDDSPICGSHIGSYNRTFVAMQYISSELFEKGTFCKNCQRCLQ